jgi:hypothetical protein
MSDVKYAPRANELSLTTKKWSKDLTRQEWSGYFDSAGTAILWLQDDSGTYEQLFVPDIDYARCLKLADALATMTAWSLHSYRWVPQEIETLEVLLAGDCGGVCKDDLDCKILSCNCFEGRCRRK